MNTVLMSRIESTDYGIFSFLPLLNLYAVERPWLENKRQVSCIPSGSYICKWRKSPKFGWCYEVTEVENRGNILIHSGNFPSHSHGCILLCKKLGYIEGKKAGLLSKPAITLLNNFGNKEDFILEIRNDYIPNNTL